MKPLIVSEVFGPTVQGEGPSVGRRCSFVRLGRCNLWCTWCDTPFTWDWHGRNGTVYSPEVELAEASVEQVMALVESHGTDLLVITGGEPLLQPDAVASLAESALARGMQVEVETNGTRLPMSAEQYVTRFNVSPKLANSGVPAQSRLKGDVLRHFMSMPASKVAFKFVVTNEDDMDEVDDLVLRLGIRPQQVWVMPEGRDHTITARLASLAESAIARNYNLTTRLHVLLWGDKRGV